MKSSEMCDFDILKVIKFKFWIHKLSFEFGQ